MTFDALSHGLKTLVDNVTREIKAAAKKKKDITELSGRELAVYLSIKGREKKKT